MRKRASFLVIVLMGIFILSNSCKKDDPEILPVLTTVNVTGITLTTSVSGGNITDDRGSTVSARGVCWSINQTPTIDNNKTEDGIGIGSFISNIVDLSPSTTYFMRAYATNSTGTGYGNELSFTTGEGVIDADGNIYNIVTIGTQTWMAENLKTTKYYDGEAIPYETAWNNLTTTTPGYSWYENDEAANKATYGALYNWHAVNTGELCPIGWHVPTDEEWSTLTTYLGGENVAGGKLKEIGTTHWVSPNTKATNETSFTALPGGFRIYEGTFSFIGHYGVWWSATEFDATNAWYRDIYYYYRSVGRNNTGKDYGSSVRCVRD